ncbi:MAG: hypothetical protein NW201_06120 [Gemmatimonadales bacterium]|nr:hypothetical protein [Gemmatimonadales bacterium]
MKRGRGMAWWPAVVLAWLGAALLARSAQAQAGGWRAVILAEAARHPGLQAADVYKLLHQGVLGTEHAIRDTAVASRWLTRELATMGEGPAEALADTIAPGGAVVRVQLRPFAARGGRPGALLEAFLRSANGAGGDTTDLRRALDTALALARAGELRVAPDPLAAFIAERAREGYPAVHHSPAYEARWRPAYRVVRGALLDGLRLRQ